MRLAVVYVVVWLALCLVGVQSREKDNNYDTPSLWCSACQLVARQIQDELRKSDSDERIIEIGSYFQKKSEFTFDG